MTPSDTIAKFLHEIERLDRKVAKAVRVDDRESYGILSRARDQVYRTAAPKMARALEIALKGFAVLANDAVGPNSRRLYFETKEKEIAAILGTGEGGEG